MEALSNKQVLFDHLVARWRNLFNLNFDVLLYDLTSTYFEADPPFSAEDKRRFGYSRDKRPDCVQVVIALVVTPEGLAPTTTSRGFGWSLEKQSKKINLTAQAR